MPQCLPHRISEFKRQTLQHLAFHPLPRDDKRICAFRFSHDALPQGFDQCLHRFRCRTPAVVTFANLGVSEPSSFTEMNRHLRCQTNAGDSITSCRTRTSPRRNDAMYSVIFSMIFPSGLHCNEGLGPMMPSMISCCTTAVGGPD